MLKAMYVESVPNRGSPPAILLRESYREDGKVRKRTLLNLSAWPRERVEGCAPCSRAAWLCRRAPSLSRSSVHCRMAMSQRCWA